MTRRFLPFACALLSSACVVIPRSAILGQTAAPVGAGNAEVAMSAGLAVTTESGAPVTNSNTVNSYTAILAPTAEGNATIGVSDLLGINFHVSPAGVQPGVKIHLLSGGLNIAVLPELGFGFLTQSSGSTPANPATQNSYYYVTFLIGAKVLVSHPSGVYGGLGYDFQWLNGNTVDNTGTNRGTDSQQANVLGLNLGYSFQMGGFSLRPELALLFMPSNSNTHSLGNASTSVSGSAFVLFPNVTVAAASGKGGGAREPEGMKPEELSLPPMIQAP